MVAFGATCQVQLSQHVVVIVSSNSYEVCCVRNEESFRYRLVVEVVHVKDAIQLSFSEILKVLYVHYLSNREVMSWCRDWKKNREGKMFIDFQKFFNFDAGNVHNDE